MSLILSNIDQRATFQNARQMLVSAGFTEMEIQQMKLTQSFLRLEQPIVAGKTFYEFPVLDNKTSPGGQVFGTEQRLALQDSFIASAVLFYVAAPASASDVAFLPKTYLDPTAFTNTTLQPWTGQAQLMVDQDVIVPYWNLMRHYKAPRTQATAPAGPGSPITEWDGSQDGFFPTEPNWVLVGSRNIKLSVSYTDGMTPIDTFSRLGWIMHGVLAQNSTPVR